MRTERTFSPSQDQRRNSFKSFASVTKEVNGGTRNRGQIYQITFQTLNGQIWLVLFHRGRRMLCARQRESIQEALFVGVVHFLGRMDRCLHTLSCVRHWSPTRLLCPQNFPGKNTRVGCHFLLLGIFPTQGLNLCLLRLLDCRQMLYHSVTWKVSVIIRVCLKTKQNTFLICFKKPKHLYDCI